MVPPDVSCSSTPDSPSLLPPLRIFVPHPSSPLSVLSPRPSPSLLSPTSLAGFTQPGSCSDIQAVNLLCGSEQAYSDLVIRNSRGDASWSIVTIEDELFAANCTDLTQVNGRRVVRGVNDSAMICKTFINETTRCLVSPMTTCSCIYPSGFTCFLSVYANYLLPLSSYSLMPKRSYVTLATLFGSFSSSSSLLSSDVALLREDKAPQVDAHHRLPCRYDPPPSSSSAVSHQKSR